jgi:hypothetical protein
MNWSPQQQAMLSAMGYALYRQAGADATGVEAAGTDNTAAPSGSPQRSRQDRLMQALVRAAGGRDPAALPLPPLDQLRGDAAAKRALWPRLRALRRQR